MFLCMDLVYQSRPMRKNRRKNGIANLGLFHITTFICVLLSNSCLFPDSFSICSAAVCRYFTLSMITAYPVSRMQASSPATSLLTA